MVSTSPGSINVSHWNGPFWDDYRPFLKRLRGCDLPDAPELSAWLPPAVRSGGGRPLRFVSAAEIPGVAYERHIFETGEVSTREKNWHDLFNALVWCRLPRLKAAMNAMHHAHLHEQRDGRRGLQRDALTLLDESGVIISSRDSALLGALASRDWRQAFVRLRDAWHRDTRVIICGHALLEKFLAPYKSLTAHALLLEVVSPRRSLSSEATRGWLDRHLAEQLAVDLCKSSGDLSPIPLMGIPGWWNGGPQDRQFYDDPSVFRPPPDGFRPAPIHLI